MFSRPTPQPLIVHPLFFLWSFVSLSSFIVDCDHDKIASIMSVYSEREKIEVCLGVYDRLNSRSTHPLLTLLSAVYLLIGLSCVCQNAEAYTSQHYYISEGKFSISETRYPTFHLYSFFVSSHIIFIRLVCKRCAFFWQTYLTLVSHLHSHQRLFFYYLIL